MIIWGSRGITSSQAKGLFHCPSCDQQRSFDHKKVRRFFTLYFIPLVPLETLGDYVECQTCKGTFKEEVLRYDPRAQQEAFQQAYQYALERTLVLMMLSDGAAQEAELQALASLHQSYVGSPLTAPAREKIIAKSTADPRSIGQHLGPLAAQLNSAGKERLLEAAVRIGAADGALQPEELSFLDEMAKALAVSSAHLKGIVAENDAAS